MKFRFAPGSGLKSTIWVLGMVTVGLQALALSARYFQPYLSADYIYPQLFAEDILSGRYPISGWTLSSAPYFFPDMIGALGLRLIGGAGTILPAYVVFSYLMAAVMAGWSLERVTNTGWTAWLGGTVLVSVLLLWQSVPGHAHFLWLFGTVGFHGGAVLLGLADFALWTGPEQNGMSRGRWAVALTVMGTGMISDTLFLVQAVLPLGVGLLSEAQWQWRDKRVRTYVGTLLLAVCLVAVVRIFLFFGGWFSFSKVVRYFPTPAAITRATAFFTRDLLATFAPEAWGLMAVSGLALIVTAFFRWRERRTQLPRVSGAKVATMFVIAALAATTLMPLVTTYWRDEHHVRYLLPWLILPGWLALAWSLPTVKLWMESARGLTIAGLIWIGLIATSLPQVRPSALGWPYSEKQAMLDQFLTDRGLRYGVSDYWHAHEINTLSHSGVNLVALRPEGTVSFWNSNAFWLYTSEAGHLTLPNRTFIITDGLEEAAILRRFGEPISRETNGGVTVWIYDEPSAVRLTRQIESEVRAFVQGRPGENQIAKSP